MELCVKQLVCQQMYFSLLLSLNGKKCQSLNCVLLFVTPLTVCSPPVSSVHGGILQARILKWVAISFSGGIFPSQGSTQISYIAGRFFLSSEPPGSPRRGHCWLKNIPWPVVFFYYNHHSQQERTLNSSVFVVRLGTLVFPDLVKKDLPVRSDVVSCHSAARLPQKTSKNSSQGSFHDPSVLTKRNGLGLPWWLSGKQSTCHCREHVFDP